MATDSPSPARTDRALVLVAHGTDNPSGQATVAWLRDRVAEALPATRVLDAYVDVQRPTLDEVVDLLVQQGITVVIVPALLSTGFHVEVDIARAVARSERVTAAPPLGPHPILADILATRLREAGVIPERPVVLAAAGSSRATGVAAVRQQADLLASLWEGPVTPAFLSAARPTVDEAMSDASVPTAFAPATAGTTRPAIAAYLLGHGTFHDRLRERDTTVSEPLGADPRLADVVVARFKEAVAAAT